MSCECVILSSVSMGSIGSLLRLKICQATLQLWLPYTAAQAKILGALSVERNKQLPQCWPDLFYCLVIKRKMVQTCASFWF